MNILKTWFLSLKTWFIDLYKKPNNVIKQNNMAKKFEIIGEVNIFSGQRSGKKFEIVNESNTNGSRGPFIVTGSSRPQKCPYCQSRGTIRKSTESGYNWECSPGKEGCGYKW